VKKGAHPPHPKCPRCGKSMYKAQAKGARVKKTDPWAYCRNENCVLCTVDQVKSVQKQPKSPPLKKVVAKKKPQKKPKAVKRVPVPKSSPVLPPLDLATESACDGEPVVVKRARNRIRRTLEGSSSSSRNLIMLTLAMLAREVGHREFSDMLIDENDLTNLYGIRKAPAVSQKK